MAQNQFPSQMTLTIAQITNATTIPSGSPVVTNNGLPFGDDQTLSPPVAISGDIMGFGSAGVTLVYFGLDESEDTWTTGTAWVAAITGTTYTGSIPIASDQFAAVVMTPDYWSSYLATNATNGVVTTSALPSPADSPGQVLLSLIVLPGDGRSLRFATAPTPVSALESPASTLAPGRIYPTNQYFPTLEVVQRDMNATYYAGQDPVTPTDAAFIAGLMYGTPYVTTQRMGPGYPTNGSLATFTVQGDVPGATNGYMCIMLYQDANAALYLLFGAAGPGGTIYTEGVNLWSPQQQGETLTLDMTALVNVFSNRLVFTVASTYSQVNPALESFMDAMKQMTKLLVKVLFAAAG